MESTKNGNLPEELQRDIFLRLPVKTLCGCKCVCKQWCALIESPSFVKQHFWQESNQGHLLLRLDIFSEPEPELEPVPVAIYVPLPVADQDGNNAMDVDEEPEFEDPELQEMAELEEMMMPEPQQPYPEGYKYALYVDETLSEYEVPCHLQMPDSACDLIGPLNGVFCMVPYRWPWGPSALLNPATRQFKPLPLVEWTAPPNLTLSRNELGLGLDPLTGDYKLVLILYFLDFSIDYLEYHCVVFVCTSDSDSWRLVDDVDPIISSRCTCTSLSNTYLNGVYYWLREFIPDTDTGVAILAFDMRTEKFQEIQVMESVDHSKKGYLALCGDLLALLMYGSIDRCIDVWIMTNEGLWTRSSRVGPVENIRSPLCFWRNNELLLETMNSFLTSYNVSTQELRALEVKRTDPYTFSHWAFVYKESLVSIKGQAGKCNLWDSCSDFIKNYNWIFP